MNILQILPQLESGGVETGTIDLAKELVARGHKAVVISAGGALVNQLKEAGAKHYRLDVHKKSLLSIISLIPAVARILRAECIDVVHARSRVPAWIAFFAAKMTNTAFITTCHGYYSKHFLSRVMGWGKYVIVISQIIGRRMIDDFGVSNEKIRLIYRGADLKKFKFRGYFVKKNIEKKVIGIIGRITPLKGHLHFIKAIPGVLSDFPGLKVLIAGDAPPGKRQYYQELLDLVEKLNLKNNVEFIGNIEDVPALLNKLDLLVLSTTTQEAFGRVVIEAGAVGVPVVATRVGGVVEIIEDQKEGILVEPSNSYAMSRAIVRALKDTQLAENCACGLKQKVEDLFSLDSLVNKTIKVYEEAAQKKRILVVKMGALGDIVLITPALKAIRKRFPLAGIEVLIKKEYKELLQTCPYIDNLIVLKGNSLADVVKKVFYLRRVGFDKSIDLQNSRMSHLICFLGGIPERFGYKNKKFGSLLNRGIKDIAKGLDPVAHQFKVLKKLDIEMENKCLELWLDKRHEENAEKFLSQNWVTKGQIIVGINPLASYRWQSKTWKLDRYAQVADKLAKELNARILFTGTAADWAEIDAIIRLTYCKPINACGKTSLMQLAALIKCCSVFLTVDSAPMHIAAAVGTPFVALFGPTDPKRHLPSEAKSVLISKDSLECIRCYRSHCYHKRCMEDITVEQVYEAMVSLILKRAERGK
ncbi:MAG: lipopolysaccharide heptosyltransferase II [Candidatus Omnitrophota bacterium]